MDPVFQQAYDRVSNISDKVAELMELDPVQFSYTATDDRTFVVKRKAGTWDIFVSRSAGDVYRVTDGTLSDVLLFLEHSERFVSELTDHIAHVRSLIPKALDAGRRALSILREEA